MDFFMMDTWLVEKVAQIPVNMVKLKLTLVGSGR